MSNIYKILNTIQKLEDSVKENLTESVAEAKQAKAPFAVGMAAAKKQAGITKTPAKDLPKKVVKKGHEIGKAIKRDLDESFDEISELARLSGLKLSRVTEDHDVIKPNTGNPYEAGYHACELGYSRKDNPYPEDHHLHDAWNNGWKECDKHQAAKALDEGKCPKCDCAECECDDMEEGNEFSGALAAAKAKGAKEFEVDGKTYPVKEGEDVCNECGMMEEVCECGQMEEGRSEHDEEDEIHENNYKPKEDPYWCVSCEKQNYGHHDTKHGFVSNCCNAPMVYDQEDLDDPFPQQRYITVGKGREFDDDRDLYENCMSAVPVTPESEDNLSVNTSYSSRDNRKTVTITAEGEQAEALLQMLNLAGLGHGDHAQKAQAVVVAQEAKEYGDTEVDEAPKHANTPDPKIEDVDAITDQGTDLNRKKSQHADKPKAGDNPLATKTDESASPLDALGRRLLKMYEGIKAK